ncbi:MAG: GNAT family N-acetyltransferase [Desulfobacterium sp.]|nr:GNAT family N-acetyltransferase [Desulfobacterium sp.]
MKKKEIEIGYKLLSNFWGRGLATELAESIIYIAFKELSRHWGRTKIIH